MQQVVALDGVRINASDVTGQKSLQVRVARDATIGEWIQSVLDDLDLNRKDAYGTPHPYRARLEREGRHLNASEIAGEVLREDDHVVLQPGVMAG